MMIWTARDWDILSGFLTMSPGNIETYHPLTFQKKQKQIHNPRYRAGVVWILLVCHLLCEASKKVRRHRLGVSKCRKQSQLQPAFFNNRRGVRGFLLQQKTYQSSDPKCRCYKGMALAPGFLLRGQHVLFFVTCPGCASSCWGQSESES